MTLAARPGLLHVVPMQGKVSSWQNLLQTVPCPPSQRHRWLFRLSRFLVWHLQNPWSLETSRWLSLTIRARYPGQCPSLQTFLFVMVVPSECAGMISKRRCQPVLGPHLGSIPAAHRPVGEGRGGMAIPILQMGTLGCWGLKCTTMVVPTAARRVRTGTKALLSLMSYSLLQSHSKMLSSALAQAQSPWLYNWYPACTQLQRRNRPHALPLRIYDSKITRFVHWALRCL